jgi:hypothetical protein
MVSNEAQWQLHLHATFGCTIGSIREIYIRNSPQVRRIIERTHGPQELEAPRDLGEEGVIHLNLTSLQHVRSDLIHIALEHLFFLLSQ